MGRSRSCGWFIHCQVKTGEVNDEEAVPVEELLLDFGEAAGVLCSYCTG